MRMSMSIFFVPIRFIDVATFALVCAYIHVNVWTVCHNQFCPIVVRLALVYAYVHISMLSATTSFVLLLSDLPWSTRMSICQRSVSQPVLSHCCQTCPGLHVCPYVNAQCHNQFCPIVVRLALVYTYVHMSTLSVTTSFVPLLSDLPWSTRMSMSMISATTSFVPLMLLLLLLLPHLL